MKESAYRINVVDALRGFAILGILMMHSFEHFNYFEYPVVENQFLRFTDTILSKSIPFLFAGKAYAIFALLFGFSFFIQDNNQLKEGFDFRGRFIWRLVLLFIWGCINSIFYTGDVLVLFSLLGLILVATARLSDKVVFGIAIFLFLMPLQWIQIIYTIFNPDYSLGPRLFYRYYELCIPVMGEGSLLDMVKNAYNSQMYSLTWWIGEGRVFQASALFLFGMLMGRRKMFLDTEENISFWQKVLIVAVICYFPLAGLLPILRDFINNETIIYYLNVILNCYASFAFMCLLVSIFVLTYYKSNAGKYLSKLEPYGKMSLTMYLSQSVLGGFVFYYWGLGLSSYLSVTFSIVVGLLIFSIQYTFAVLWLKSHNHGPLEYIWKELTWIGRKRKKDV